MRLGTEEAQPWRWRYGSKEGGKCVCGGSTCLYYRCPIETRTAYAEDLCLQRGGPSSAPPPVAEQEGPCADRPDDFSRKLEI